MTDQEIIERLWLFAIGDFSSFTDCTGMTVLKEGFNPMMDWNHWRQVEEKVMERDENLVLWERFMEAIVEFNETHPSWNELWNTHKADLPTRCKALVSVLK